MAKTLSKDEVDLLAARPASEVTAEDVADLIATVRYFMEARLTVEHGVRTEIEAEVRAEVTPVIREEVRAAVEPEVRATLRAEFEQANVAAPTGEGELA